MKKLLIICGIIIVGVIASDIVLKRAIFKDFDYMISILNEIENESNTDLNKKKIYTLNNCLEEKKLIMAFYIDHGELEKINTQFVIVNAALEKQDEKFLYEEVQRTIFIVQHLQKKIEFNLENIL